MAIGTTIRFLQRTRTRMLLFCLVPERLGLRTRMQLMLALLECWVIQRRSLLFYSLHCFAFFHNLVKCLGSRLRKGTLFCDRILQISTTKSFSLFFKHPEPEMGNKKYSSVCRKILDKFLNIWCFTLNAQ